METPVPPTALSPVAELRRLYRDSETKAGRLKMIVEARNGLDRKPTDEAINTVLGAIAKGTGASELRLVAEGETRDWIYPGDRPVANSSTDRWQHTIEEPIGTGGEWTRLTLTLPHEPLTDDDLRAVTVVVSQLATFLAARRQAALQEKLTCDLAVREQELARLVASMLSAQERERARVAYDLHDGVAQTLVSLLYHLHAGEPLIGTDHPARSIWEKSIDIARGAIGDVRHAIADLRPAELDDLGLEAALRARLDSMGLADLRFASNLAGIRLPRAVELSLYRVAQEALTNVVKHAEANRVELDLTLEHGHPATIVLTIADDGKGPPACLPTPAQGEGVGLSAMRERLSVLGGSLSFEARPTGGTLVRATLPLPHCPEAV